METKSFIKILRKVIREEVQLVVRKEMRSMLSEKKVNHKKAIKHGMELHDSVESIHKPAIKKKKFVKDSMLNDILNETAYGADFSTMNDVPAVYQSSMANEFASTRQSAPMHSAPLVTNDVNGAPINMQNKNVAKTIDIMTKDYSQLMKVIDKKKGK